jgi:hypothetical protein
MLPHDRQNNLEPVTAGLQTAHFRDRLILVLFRLMCGAPMIAHSP